MDRFERVARLEPSRTLLAVIDVQERLLPVMEERLRDRMLANLLRLGEARRALGFPVLLTEQYPKGLGHTVPEVRAAFEAADPLPKICFDAFEEEAIRESLDRQAPDAIVVAGLETHVCVFQSVRTLVDRGHRVLVLKDAVASRTKENWETGLELVRECGALVTSVEAVLFDLVARSGTDAFRAISKIVR